MKNLFAGVGLGGLWVISICVFSIVAFGMYALLAPMYESVRRDVMIESRYYSEATVRELYRLKRQWDDTDDLTARATIAAAARHEFSIFPQDRLPPDLQVWFAQIQ